MLCPLRLASRNRDGCPTITTTPKLIITVRPVRAATCLQGCFRDHIPTCVYTGSLRNTCLPYKIGNKMKHKHYRWKCLFKWCLSQILSFPAYHAFGLKRGKWRFKRSEELQLLLLCHKVIVLPIEETLYGLRIVSHFKVGRTRQ